MHLIWIPAHLRIQVHFPPVFIHTLCFGIDLKFLFYCQILSVIKTSAHRLERSVRSAKKCFTPLKNIENSAARQSVYHRQLSSQLLDLKNCTHLFIFARLKLLTHWKRFRSCKDALRPFCVTDSFVAWYIAIKNTVFPAH